MSNRLHGLRVETDYLDENKRRQPREPQAVLGVMVGKTERIHEIPLTYKQLLDLNQQVAAALLRVPRDGV